MKKRRKQRTDNKLMFFNKRTLTGNVNETIPYDTVAEQKSESSIGLAGFSFSKQIATKYSIFRKSCYLPALIFLRLFGTRTVNNISNISYIESINNDFRINLDLYFKALSEVSPTVIAGGFGSLGKLWGGERNLQFLYSFFNKGSHERIIDIVSPKSVLSGMTRFLANAQTSPEREDFSVLPQNDRGQKHGTSERIQEDKTTNDFRIYWRNWQPNKKRDFLEFLPANRAGMPPQRASKFLSHYIFKHSGHFLILKPLMRPTYSAKGEAGKNNFYPRTEFMRPTAGIKADKVLSQVERFQKVRVQSGQPNFVFDVSPPIFMQENPNNTAGENLYFCHQHNQESIMREVEEIKRVVTETRKEVGEKSHSAQFSDEALKKPLDINRLADQVYQNIERRIRIERERRGL